MNIVANLKAICCKEKSRATQYEEKKEEPVNESNEPKRQGLTDKTKARVLETIKEELESFDEADFDAAQVKQSPEEDTSRKLLSQKDASAQNIQLVVTKRQITETTMTFENKGVTNYDAYLDIVKEVDLFLGMDKGQNQQTHKEQSGVTNLNAAVAQQPEKKV